MFKMSDQWHKHKHTGMLAIGQLCRQSATAPSRVTHTRSRHCHSSATSSTMISDTCCWMRQQIACLHRAFIPVSRYLKVIKIHQHFTELYHKITASFFNERKCISVCYLVLVRELLNGRQHSDLDNHTSNIYWLFTGTFCRYLYLLAVANCTVTNEILPDNNRQLSMQKQISHF